jgi:hypothetical protein
MLGLMEQDIDTKAASTKSLPSIQTLFVDSWHLFLKSLLNLFLFNLIGYVAIFALIMIAVVVVGVGAGLFGVLNSGSSDQITSVLTTLALPAMLLLLVFTVAIIVLALITQIGSIIILTNGNSQESLSVVFKKSLNFVWPAFLMGLVTSFIVWGSSFLLLIPGIVFGIFFAFSMFVLVTHNAGPLNALRTSMGLVKQNFWGIVGRLLLIFTLTILLQLLVQGSVISLIINVVLGWFSMAYLASLYKQASSVSGNQTASLKLPLMVSLIGWVIGGFVLSSMIYWMVNYGLQDGFKKLPTMQDQQMLDEEYNLEDDLDVDTNTSIRVE